MKSARTILTRKGFDMARMDLRVQKGICYIRGIVAPLPGVTMENMETAMEHCGQLIRQKPEIRMVVIECTYQR